MLLLLLIPSLVPRRSPQLMIQLSALLGLTAGHAAAGHGEILEGGTGDAEALRVRRRSVHLLERR